MQGKQWKPVPGRMLTSWGEQVTPENAWREYPRPQMVRPDWLNLNGLWEYAVLPKDQPYHAEIQGQVLVPFPLESCLSGVARSLGTDERLWYRRSFTIPPAWAGKRILLHFGAVDWEAQVFVNGSPLGIHRGGYLPFSFDITPLLQPGQNELLVSVWDPSDDGGQPRGKQVRRPHTIWYTTISGIWQTVWLEPVPDGSIDYLKITPDIDRAAVTVQVDWRASSTQGSISVPLRVQVMDAGVPVAEAQGSIGEPLTLPIPDPNLWSPDSPHLYDLQVTAGQDRVTSYFGMRKFHLEAGRLCLNNQPLFQYGPLDQGYWPDGLYTPPSEEAMRADIDLVKRLGCNMLRKHIKVEPACYYEYCDRVGLIVWQDMPNGGREVDEVRMFFITLLSLRWNDHRYRRFGRQDPENRLAFRRELQEMVDHLHNFASIGMWVPFNEAWGQFDAKSIADWLKSYDPTRTVDHASGWFDQGGGDCDSWHVYFRPLKVKQPSRGRAGVLSEFGGYSLRLEGHLWDPQVKFGYKSYPDKKALTDAYINLLSTELQPWVEAGLSAAVYTQTADVENEVNGYVTYDRRAEKMDFQRVRAAHSKLLSGD